MNYDMGIGMPMPSAVTLRMIPSMIFSGTEKECKNIHSKNHMIFHVILPVHKNRRILEYVRECKVVPGCSVTPG